MIFFFPRAHLALGDRAAESKRGTQTLFVGVEAKVANHDPIARLRGERREKRSRTSGVNPRGPRAREGTQEAAGNSLAPPGPPKMVRCGRLILTEVVGARHERETMVLAKANSPRALGGGEKNTMVARWRVDASRLPLARLSVVDIPSAFLPTVTKSRGDPDEKERGEGTNKRTHEKPRRRRRSTKMYEYFVCYLSHAMKRSQAPERAD